MVELLIFITFILLGVRHRFFWCARDRRLKYPTIMAHRGMKMVSPENTIASYQEAVDIGFTALELDILQTKDGELICSHNFDLERETNGHGWIHQSSLSQLEDVQTGVYSHPSKTQSMPRFLDALDTIPKNIFLNIEIKTHSLFDLSTANSVKEMIKNGIIKHTFIISSFHPIVVAYLRLLCPEVSIGFILQDMEWLWVTHWIHPDYLHPQADQVDDELIELSKRHNLPLSLWTVNTIPAIEWCRKNNISGIITDNPQAIHS